MAERVGRGFGEYSGVARAVELLEGRWSLLIVRNLLAGARRYSDLKAALPRIPTNILSDRLRDLQGSGILRRVPAVRGGYELTPVGRALLPVVVELERWGSSLLGDIDDDEIVTADGLAVTLHAAFRAAESLRLPPTEYLLHVRDTSISAIVHGGTLDVIPVGPNALPTPRRRIEDVPAPDLLELHLEPAGLHDLLSGGSGPRTEQPVLLDRFRRTFRIDPRSDEGAEVPEAA